MQTERPKRILIAILAAIATIFAGANASAAFQIYKVKGDVSVSSGKKTIKAERRAIVKPSDLLIIPAEGSVDILDTDSRRIYSSVETGKMTVKALMEKAESHASDITRNINRKVIAAVADNADKKHGGYDAMGMAIHETDAIAFPPVALPEGMSYLSYLLASAKDPDSTHQSYISLSKREIEGGFHDGAFHFVLHNSMRQPLYFNIISRNDDQEGLSLIFAQNPIASPKDDTVAEEYVFLPNADGRGYVAIASDVDFTLDDVKRLLEAGYDPDDEYYLTILGGE